jgi:pimeloyl-ACP methyl ester carboxylesterase
MDINYVVIPAVVVLVACAAASCTIWRLTQLNKSGRSPARKLIERTILWPFTMIFLAVGLSTTFNAVALYWYRQPPPGNVYRVNGQLMRMECMGQGFPTLVLESGAGNDGLTWVGLQPKLAMHTQVCSYDRAGLGWSDPLPRPRDADHIAAELHGLLASAHVTRPVILMGHSMGGLFIRDYAAHYPSEVAGLIFEDSSTPLQNRNPAYVAYDGPRKATQFNLLFNKVIFVLGVPRLFGTCSGKLDRRNTLTTRVFYEDRCHQPVDAIKEEADDFDLSGQETMNTGPFGDMPILILTHDTALDVADGLPDRLIHASEANQESLLNLSDRSRQIIAKGSGHYIHLQRPDLVEREVFDFVDRVRGIKPDPDTPHSVTEE